MELLNKDNAKKLVKPSILAALSQVPIASAFSTFYSEFVNSNWQERVEKTQEELINKFSKLEEDFETKIKSKENFSSILGTAYQSALTDVDVNKIPIYINSLINIIDNESIDNSKVHIFLNIIKEFTVLHIETLEYFSTSHPDTYDIRMDLCRTNMPTYEEKVASIIEQTNKNLTKDLNLLNKVIFDLHNSGLIEISQLSDIKFNGFGRQQIPKFITTFGEELLKLIKEPDNKL